MKELLKKTYEIKLLWQTLKYEQFSLYECLEFQHTIQSQPLEDWIYNFLKTKIKVNKLDLLKIDLKLLMETLFDTAFKGFFWKWKWWESMPFEAYVMFISKEFNLHPEAVMKKYTPEALACYMDWIIRNYNSQTKEWQKKNRINKAMKEMKKTSVEDDLKEIEEMRKKLKT